MPGTTSRLAALYLDTNHREVYYQVEDPKSHSIYCYRIGSSNPRKCTYPVVAAVKQRTFRAVESDKDIPVPNKAMKIPGTSYAMPGTPIAVTKSKAGNVYLYYLSKPGSEGYANIQRTDRVNSEWQATASVKSEFDFAVSTVLETQLAVTQVAVKDKLQNTVFYLGSSDEQYKPIRDKGEIK